MSATPPVVCPDPACCVAKNCTAVHLLPRPERIANRNAGKKNALPYPLPFAVAAVATVTDVTATDATATAATATAATAAAAPVVVATAVTAPVVVATAAAATAAAATAAAATDAAGPAAVSHADADSDDYDSDDYDSDDEFDEDPAHYETDEVIKARLKARLDEEFGDDVCDEEGDNVLVNKAMALGWPQDAAIDLIMDHRGDVITHAFNQMMAYHQSMMAHQSLHPMHLAFVPRR